VLHLTEHQKQRFREGIDLFNTGRFFDCHEALEEVWLDLSGDRKQFMQGLIQLTVALHHLSKQNRVGAERLLAAASEKLALDSPERDRIDMEALLAAVASLRAQLKTSDTAASVWTPPTIHLKENSNR
jgi:predicted metal-dependent hydrolase